MKRNASDRKRDLKSVKNKSSSQETRKLKIGIVQARFNSNITDLLKEGCQRRLTDLGVLTLNTKVITVPGAIEIPLAAQLLFEQGCDGIVAIGCVIRGETTHYEFVINSVERACTALQLEHRKPVTSAVLTVENLEQALDRVGGHSGHKGEEAADVVVEMALLCRQNRKSNRRGKS